MKTKIILILCFILLSGFDKFSIDHFDKYEKEYKTEDMSYCENDTSKTYMPYTAITNKASKQYKLIHEEMTIDDTGMIYDKDGFIAAALASDFGPIGSRYYMTLSSGIVLPIIKADAKPDEYTNGCAANSGHIIEFIIDDKKGAEYFGTGPTGLVNFGNFNNDYRFKGKIIKIEKVLDEKVENSVTYIESDVNISGDIGFKAEEDLTIYGGF